MKLDGILRNTVVLHTPTAVVHQVVAIPVPIGEAKDLVERTTEGTFFFLRKVGFEEITRHTVVEMENDFRPFISPITLSLIAEPPTPTMFPLYQTLVCATTGAKFGILGTPDQYLIEVTGEPAYTYCGYRLEADGTYTTLPPIHVRSQKEMEDGRFVIADQDYQRKSINFKPLDGLRDYPFRSGGTGNATRAAIESLTNEPTRGTS